jgi:ParB/RepB/Spo0J family partition protein
MKKNPNPNRPFDNESFEMIDVATILESPYQSRIIPFTESSVQTIEEKSMEELKGSISSTGLMTPILVRKTDKGYELIDGHRRVLAHRALGIEKIKSIVTKANDREAQLMGIVGNLQRKNLTTMELAMAYRKMLDESYYKDKKELSLALGKDETYVGDLLNTLSMDSRIVEDLAKNSSIKDLKILRIIRNTFPAGGKQTCDPQWELYQRVVDEGLTRTQLKALLSVKKYLGARLWKIKTSGRTLELKIGTGKMTDLQKEKLQKLLDEKLGEIIGML